MGWSETSNSGHQLLLPPAHYRPMFAGWTTHCEGPGCFCASRCNLTVSPGPHRALRPSRASRCGTPQRGLYPGTMALITSDCDAMRSPSIKWP